MKYSGVQIEGSDWGGDERGSKRRFGDSEVLSAWI